MAGYEMFMELKLEFYNDDYDLIHDIRMTSYDFDNAWHYNDICLSRQPFKTFWLCDELKVQDFFAFLMNQGTISLSFDTLKKHVKYLRIFEL